MNIEIQQPKLEALILQRLASGRFRSVEDVLLRALESTPLADEEQVETSARTGADLVAAMQAMPSRDDIDLEHSRPHMQVRDAEF